MKSLTILLYGRMLVMKKSAGSNSGMFSPVGAGGYQDVSRSRSGAGDSPLIQQVGPDFSRLSRDLNRVVLKIQHQSDSGDCPMHSEESRRNSRAYTHETESRRGSRAYEVTHRSSSAEIHGSGPSGHRLLSARNSNPETQYMSLPRRLSSAQSKSNSKVDRRQSFQDFKTFRDKFTGPLDFKSTLRSSSSGGAPSRHRDSGAEHKNSARKSRQTSEPRDYEERRGSGYLIESDFDFRSPPSTRDNSRERRSRYGDYDPGARDYYASDVSGGPRRGQGQSGRQQQSSERKYQYGYQDLKNQVQSPVTSPGIKINVMSPVGSRHDPLSPRRVEFADEVFNFSQGKGTPATSRPGSRCESPTPKGILRHTTSDPSQRGGGHRSNTVELANLESKSKAKEAVRSNTTDLSFCQPDNSDKNAPSLLRPTSLIIPDHNDNNVNNPKNSQPLVKILLSDEHNDSDDTLIEEKHETEESKERVVESHTEQDSVGKRKVPPALADWNRSQSFPPPGASKDQGLMPSNLRKSSDPLDSSHASLLSGAMTEYPSNDDLDLIHDDNQSLRVRVGDLEKQVHDNNDEIKCLRATLAECLRKIGDIESVIRHSEQRHQRRQRDMSAEPAKSNRKAHVSSSIFGSQDFSNRATFEIHNPPQRGTYAPRQR